MKFFSHLKMLPAVLLLLGLLACSSPTAPALLTPLAATPLPSATVSPSLTPSATPSPSLTPIPPSVTPVPSATFTATPDTGVPAFSHIVIIVLENREFGLAIGSPEMPAFNAWAQQYTLLTQHYAIRHPSLPNYLALLGGDTFGVDSNCKDCYINAPSLPDLIEAGGRSWKTYQEDMPEPCFAGDAYNYAQKHNPFMYFDAIRLDAERCRRSVVPLTELDRDLAAQTLPDFVFITPNLCNSAHDCTLRTADLWLSRQVAYLLAYPAIAKDGLIVLTWDEGQGDHGCCGFEPGGGRVATVLLSPLARSGFQDDTQYTHYSLLKTISAAWRLEELGLAKQAALITLPWLP